MPISENISKQIVELSNQNTPAKLFAYLKEKTSDETITWEEIYTYAKVKIFSQKTPKTYIISADIINKLGVFVANLDDKEQATLAVKFYKLAADRESSWGCQNYAQMILNGDHSLVKEDAAKEALEYAKKAVALSEKLPNMQHQHALTLCKALRANNAYGEANIVLIAYLNFWGNKKPTKGGESGVEKKIKAVISLCEEIIKQAKKKKWNQKSVEENLKELEPFMANSKLFNQLKASNITLDITYIQARCYEIQGELAKAMQLYCALPKDYVDFSKVIAARKRLLKAQVAKQLMPTAMELASQPSSTSSMEIDSVPDEGEKESILLPGNIPLPTNFNENWSKDTTWFHSADEKAIHEECEKRKKQITTLITAKKYEIDLLDEALAKNPKQEWVDAQKKLTEELKSLRRAEKKLEETYEIHLPDNRSRFRNHTAESRFFQPERSKKNKQLIELTNGIIDQRYSTESHAPLSLNGVSSRQLITAERVFQEAVVALTGDKKPTLGIPTARTSSWAIDYSHGTTGYGPVELYQVGNTEIQAEHRTSPKRPRLGDTYLPQHKAYNSDIYPFLKKLAKDDVDKEKQLASFMLRYSKAHQAISLEELQAVYPQAAEDDVNHFNSICFLIMEKEQSQWHSATDEQYQLGMMVAQARCLIMLTAGFICFKEAFKNDVFFGVYSKTKIINEPKKVADACRRINELYLAYLQVKLPQEYMSFTKKNITSDNKYQCVLTREQAHRDLKETYGGASDTDGEGYDSDLSM